MGQADSRWVKGRRAVRNDNSGPQQSCVLRRTNDVAQVFYVKDVSTKPRKNKQKNISDDEPKRQIVLSGKRNIVGVEDKTDMSENYDKFHEIPPFAVKDDPSLMLINEDAPLLRRRKKPKH